MGLGSYLSLAEVWGLRPDNSNPCRSITRYRETRRKRFLNAAELASLGASMDDGESTGLPWSFTDAEPSKHWPKEANRKTLISKPAMSAIRLLLLTGARLSEILELEWAHVSFTEGMIALPSRKGAAREPHPASQIVLDLLAALPRPAIARWVLPRPDDPSRHVSKEVVENAWQRLRAHAG